jgi:hypothetical protein
MEVDFSRLDFATATKVDAILRGQWDEQIAAAAERQRRIAFINHLHRPLAKDGFGERTLMIDPVVDALWRQYYGDKYTQDPELVKFLCRRNPEITVRSRGTKEISVGWMPGRTSKRPIGLESVGLKPKRTSKMKTLKTAIIGAAVMVSTFLHAGIFTNSILTTNNVASGVVTTNLTGTALPIVPFRDAVIYAGLATQGTNAATASGTLGFNLYDPVAGQWTTTQPISATVSLSPGATWSVGRFYFSHTNLYGATFIRWDTASLTGATNGTFTNVDFVQFN